MLNGIDTTNTYLYNEQYKPRRKDKAFRDLSINIRSRSEHKVITIYIFCLISQEGDIVRLASQVVN